MTSVLIGSELTFSILLSEAGVDFDGGGTYFQAIDKTVHLTVGSVLLHCGKLKHSGEEITSGQRYIVSVHCVVHQERKKEPTNVSPFFC